MNVFLIAASFLVSAAASAGVGGGGLFTLCLIAAGSPQYEAQGINLFAFVFAAVPAAVYHALKNKADIGLAAYLSFCGCTGCMIGSMLAASAAQKTLRTAFGVFALAVGTASAVRQIREAKSVKSRQSEDGKS